MATGVSIGDLITAGQLAYSLFKRCKAASADYQELGNLCSEVSMTIDSCRPNDANTSLRWQNSDAMQTLSTSCQQTLGRLDNLLSKYEKGTGFQAIVSKMIFVNAKEERDNITQRLKLHLLVIGTFMSGENSKDLQTIKEVLAVSLTKAEETSEDPAAKILARDEQAKDLQLIKGMLVSLTTSGLSNEKHSEMGSAGTSLAQANLPSLIDLEEDQPLSSIAALNLSPTTAKDMSEISPDPETSSAAKVDGKLHAERVKAKSVGPSFVPTDLQLINKFLAYVYRNPKKWTRWTPSPLIHARGPLASPEIVWWPDAPTTPYTPDDQFFCTFPEGWSATPTLIRRYGKTEEAYFYMFNNLSCAPDNTPKTSRSYARSFPFSAEGDRFKEEDAGFFYWASLGGYALNNPQDSDYYKPCSGFVGPQNFCFDLKDAASFELASFKPIGWQRGCSHLRQATERITQTLDPRWKLELDAEDGPSHRYIHVTTGWTSTVHPARFWNPEDDSSATLPPGWDRRLDSWGNLFFVDHNTCTSKRVDPRFDRETDQEIGLPIGWRRVKDHKNRSFFFKKSERALIGTYDPALADNHGKGMKYLDQLPKEGMRAIEVAVPTLDKEQSVAYKAVFKAAPKKSGIRITLAEATAQFKEFGLTAEESEKILSEADDNKDGRWNVDEYIKALHQLHVKILRWVKPLEATTEDIERYEKWFEATTSEPTMSLAEVFTACVDLDLPESRVEAIFSAYDDNGDQEWNPDEFCSAMHQCVFESEKRKALGRFTRQADASSATP